MASQVSLQETLDKLNQALPVRLSAGDTEHNPEFVKLLVALCRHVGEKGTSTRTTKEYDEIKENLEEKKRKYLQANTLYTEIKDILMDYTMTKQENRNSSTENQVYHALQTTLSSAEAIDYLDFTPEGDKDVTLLGLKPDALILPNTAQLRNQQQSFQQYVIPELESRMKSKCELIINIHDPSTSNESGGLSLAKAGQLPALLAKEKQTLEEEKRKLSFDRIKRDKQFRQYYQALLQSLTILEQLISKHRLQAQLEYDKITTNWLAAKCDAMCLKIKVLQNQLIRDTYTPETTAALKKIREHLIQADEEESKELQRATHALQAYESVGMGFDSLVQEYTLLLNEIDNKKWALSELRQSQDTEHDDLWRHR